MNGRIGRKRSIRLPIQKPSILGYKSKSNGGTSPQYLRSSFHTSDRRRGTKTTNFPYSPDANAALLSLREHSGDSLHTSMHHSSTQHNLHLPPNRPLRQSSQRCIPLLSSSPPLLVNALQIAVRGILRLLAKLIGYFRDLYSAPYAKSLAFP